MEEGERKKAKEIKGERKGESEIEEEKIISNGRGKKNKNKN